MNPAKYFAQKSGCVNMGFKFSEYTYHIIAKKEGK